MKMRVSITRALVSRPQILPMDESFAALDEMTRDRLNGELLRLYAEQKWTVLFVTHSVAEAVFLSTRIVILAPHPGRMAHEMLDAFLESQHLIVQTSGLVPTSGGYLLARWREGLSAFGEEGVDLGAGGHGGLRAAAGDGDGSGCGGVAGCGPGVVAF